MILFNSVLFRKEDFVILFVTNFHRVELTFKIDGVLKTYIIIYSYPNKLLYDIKKLYKKLK